jgi:hypothetical protein
MRELQNLPLRERRIDVFFAVVFVVFALSTGISDTIPTFGIELTPDSANPVVRANYSYAMGTDPLFMHPPVWMRMVTGLSLFVYAPFYLVLAWCLVKGKNGIQLPAVMFASVICVVTGVIVFGVEFFGEAEFRTPNPVKYLSLNLPYVLVPLLLLVRMRKPMPFTRKF